MLKPVIVAQISDLHVRRRGHVLHHMANTAAFVERAVERLNRLRVDAVIATGDLTESGTLLEYRRLRGLLTALHAPFFLLPGNHDDRQVLRRVFRDHAYLSRASSHASFVVEAWPIRIVALDTSHPLHVGGYLDTERLAWLDAQLSAVPHRPTILACHHPPFRTGIGIFDRQRFTGRDELSQIVRRHPQIARVASGHIHTVLQRPWSGTLACTAPSTAPQFVIGRSALGIGIEAAGFLAHAFDWNAGVSTSVIRLSGEPLLLSA